MTIRISLNKARAAVTRKMPFATQRKIQESLNDCVTSYFEAYIVGTEAAQEVILHRINALAPSKKGSK